MLREPNAVHSVTMWASAKRRWINMSIFLRRPSVMEPVVARAPVSRSNPINQFFFTCLFVRGWLIKIYSSFSGCSSLVSPISIDSCSTAKCGPQKRCVIRGGEPKCVCAPKCKTSSPLSASHHTKQRFGDAQKSRRNINGNAHERDQRYHRRHSSSSSSLTDAPIAIHNRINGGGGSGADGGGGGDDGSGLMAARYSFNQNNNHKNASMPKKDKVISIVSPSSQNSHRFRKNSHLSMIKSPSSSQHHHQAHNETAQNHEHRDLRHGRKHRYNQHGGVDHRRNEQNASWEDRIRSGFYGHDLPYPPDDVPLVCAIVLRIFASFLFYSLSHCLSLSARIENVWRWSSISSCCLRKRWQNVRIGMSIEKTRLSTRPDNTRGRIQRTMSK